MKFADPQQVTCPHCSAVQHKSVDSLLDLAATCDSCGKKLDQVGREMRRLIDEWRSFIGMIEMTMALEDRFGLAITDDELEASDTVDAFDALICRKRGELGVDEVFDAIKEALRALNPPMNAPAHRKSSLRALFFEYPEQPPNNG